MVQHTANGETYSECNIRQQGGEDLQYTVTVSSGHDHQGSQSMGSPQMQ